MATTALFAASCGSGAGGSQQTLSLHLRTTGRDSAAVQGPHRHEFYLVGANGKHYRPHDLVSSDGRVDATFDVPHAAARSEFTDSAPQFYTVIGQDRDIFTGVSTLMVPYVKDSDERDWYFAVDTRNDALLGVEVLWQASQLAAQTDTAIYDQLAALWGIDDANLDQRYASVARAAGQYSIDNPVASPDAAAREILNLLGIPPSSAAVRASDPAQANLSAGNIYTVAGAFASATAGLISPFLGATVSAVFGVLAGEQNVTLAEFEAYAQVVQTQISVLNNQLTDTEKALKEFVIQTDETETAAAMGNVTADVNTIQVMYRTQFLRTFSDYDVDLADAEAALASNVPLRETLEGVLSSANIDTLNVIVARYVPTIDLVPESPQNQYLAVLNTQLDQDMSDLTAYGTFSSINTAFTQYDSLYGGAAMAVALGFDVAGQMYGMAEYLKTEYGATDNYYPAGIPSVSTLPACGTQTLSQCLANAFVTSNGQASEFMSGSDLDGSNPSIILPASDGGNGNYLASCTIDDWQQASRTNDDDGQVILISQAGSIDVTCRDIGGGDVQSTFTYTECGGNSITNENGFLSCNNTNLEYFSSSDFSLLGSIDTTTKKTIDISLQLYNTSQPSVSIVYQTNDSSSGNAWIQPGDGGTYLYDTGSTGDYIAVIRDDSTGYAFNLIYTYESMSLGCPNSGVGGYIDSYCRAVDFGSNTEICPVGSSTYPWLCSCVHIDNTIYYCLEQWESCGDGCDRYEEIATLTSCPTGSESLCQAPE